MNELRTIKLSGSLARQFGRENKLAVANTAEAVRALCAMRPGFEKFLMEAKDRGLTFAVFVDRENITKDELNNPIGASVIRIMPVLAGSKRAGVLNVIAGAVLTAVGAVMVFGLGWTGVGAFVGKTLMASGISMMDGGIVQMQTPVPKDRQREEDDRRSYTFNGPLNARAQGASVPLLYGELIVGSVVVSAGISVEDNYFVPTNDNYSGGGGRGDGGGFRGDIIRQVQ